MKHKLLILSSMVLGSLAAQPVLAQSTNTAPATRAEVKAEQKRAEAAGEVPKGDVVVPDATKKRVLKGESQTSRAEVAAEGRRAERAGEIPKGDVTVPDATKKRVLKGESQTSRESVKAGVTPGAARTDLPQGDTTSPVGKPQRP